jgi:ABC-type transporter MlaC component
MHVQSAIAWAVSLHAYLVFCNVFVPLQAQGSASEQAMLQQQLDPLMRVAKAHAKGTEEYARSIVHEVLSQFADVEEMFQTSSGVTTEQVRCFAACQAQGGLHQSACL